MLMNIPLVDPWAILPVDFHELLTTIDAFQIEIDIIGGNFITKLENETKDILSPMTSLSFQFKFKIKNIVNA